jgi:hypothetical protein
MAAAGLADVGARDPQPLVLGRRRQHLCEQIAVASLEIVPLVQSPAGVGDAIGKRVANPLELLQAGDAGLARAGRDAGLDDEAGEGLSTEARKLVFEPADLTAQLRARQALAPSYSKRRRRFSIEQILHEPNRV